MRRTSRLALFVFLPAILGAAAVEAASTVFVALPPCRIADTRVAGGPIASGTNRIFKVLGAVDLTTQGGSSATGCGVPDFNGSIPVVQAIAVNIAAANPTGGGFLTAFAGDSPRPLASTVNYANLAATFNIANGVIVPVRQLAPAGTDMKVFASTATDVFMDVTGYFTDINLVETWVNTTGDTMTGLLTLDPASGFALETGTGDDINLGGNVFKGGALFLHNPGPFNLALGVGALAPSSTGTNNTALGTDALFANTTGSENTASGAAALSSNTTGYNNTAAGFGTLETNTTGKNDTAIGSRALLSNTSGYENTASGAGALALNTVGFHNTATGAVALYFNTAGSDNTALGTGALFHNTTSNVNTAIGRKALFYNTTGDKNTAVGGRALQANFGGSFNTAIGYAALRNKTVGGHNIALGAGAGYFLTAGDDDIYIGGYPPPPGTESTTIRIGNSNQNRTFVAGIRGVATGTADAVTVMIDSNGQLGTASSSARFKEEIRDMEGASERILALRPVTFRYKPEVQAGERPTEYGLIAEEVAEVFPELVVYGKDGLPETVRYHVLVPLLLNELQKQKTRVEERERDLEARLARQQAALARQEDEIALQRNEAREQREEIAALLARLAAVEGRAGVSEPRMAQAQAPLAPLKRR